jgi:hypothetical protein
MQGQKGPLEGIFQAIGRTNQRDKIIAWAFWWAWESDHERQWTAFIKESNKGKIKQVEGSAIICYKMPKAEK